MAGREVCAEMQAWLAAQCDEGRLLPHDVATAGRIAAIVTGGDVDADAELSENELLALERRAFTDLARTPQTRDRIRNMLEHGTLLRN